MTDPIIKILPTDRLFFDSPYEGDPDCICSRCLKPIKEGEGAIRAWPENGDYEFRFHPGCLGFKTFDEIDAYSPD